MISKFCCSLTVGNVHNHKGKEKERKFFYIKLHEPDVYIQYLSVFRKISVWCLGKFLAHSVLNKYLLGEQMHLVFIILKITL